MRYVLSLTQKAPAPHTIYEVVVNETGSDGEESSSTHTVAVSEVYLDELGIVGIDTERLVRESFMFLLERESKDSILKKFHLKDIETYFPEYRSWIQALLA